VARDVICLCLALSPCVLDTFVGGFWPRILGTVRSKNIRLGERQKKLVKGKEIEK